jgi:TPR repeat protein
MRSPLAACSLLAWTACAGSSQPPAPSEPPPPQCEASECNTQGMLALGLQRPDEALRLLGRSCSLGYATGCSNLAGALRSGLGGCPKDPPRALGLYDRACHLGLAEACSTVGTMLSEGTAVPADPPRALAMFEQACAKQDASGCFTAGLLHEQGRGAPARDSQRAAGWFAQACGLGHATGCFNAGLLLYRDAGARPGENEEAVGYFARACEKAQPAGCLRQGLAALRGVGAAADTTLAASLFARACEGGEEDGCGLAEQLRRARGKKIEVALTSRAPTLTMAGLTAHDLACRMPETDPLALAEALEGVAAQRPALDACAPAGDAVTIAWSYRGGRATQVRVEAADPAVAGCVRKAVARARSSLTASCTATLLIGEAAGARQALAERRSTATGAGTPQVPAL